MTHSGERPTPAPVDTTVNSTAEGASYRPRHSSPSGKRALANPAQKEAGTVQHRGARDRGAATEGGPQQEEKQPSRRERRAAKNAARERKRSPKSEAKKRTYVCSVRLNDDEKRLLTLAATAARTNLPAFLARSGLAAARDAESAAGAIAGERELISEMFSARRDLGHVGNNLNQVARAINMGARPADPLLDAALSSVQQATERVQAAADKLLEQH